MSDLPNPNKLDELGKPFLHNDNFTDPPAKVEPAKVEPAKVEPRWESGGYYSRPVSKTPNPDRGGDFTPMTWVMIVVAGIALGFAIAMMFAGA